jgi:hypothetical protein
VGKYGPASSQVEQLIEHVERTTLDEAADLFEAHATRLLIQGPESARQALALARKYALAAGLENEYAMARRDAANAWRHSLPETRGPWLLVGQAIANAAGAMVVYPYLDDKELKLLIGPWRQAMGTLVPVGPGARRRANVLTR